MVGVRVYMVHLGHYLQANIPASKLAQSHKHSVLQLVAAADHERGSWTAMSKECVCTWLQLRLCSCWEAGDDPS